MELEQIMEESIAHQEKEFFNKKMYYSYSSLNKLLWNPQVFYQMYVLGLKEEKLDTHLVQGKLIHLLLLEPHKFDQEFMVCPSNLPTGTLRIVIDRVYRHHQELQLGGDQRQNLDEFTNAILDVMKDINYFQALKTDQQRIDKIITPEAIIYWSFLKAKGTKTLIDEETHKFCSSAVDIIKTNKQVCSLIGCDVTEFDSKKVINEATFCLDIPGRNYGIKGIIDNIVVDDSARCIYVNDIKTTSKDLKEFPESIEYYSYWLQAVMYMTAITINFGHLINSGYVVKFHFVVIDRMYQTYAFPVSETTLSVWFDRYTKALEVADWHYTNRKYDLPYDFEKGNVIL